MLSLDMFYKDTQKLTRRPFQGDVSFKVRPIAICGTAETFVLELFPLDNPDFTLASLIMDKEKSLEIAQQLLNTIANFSEEDSPLDQVEMLPAGQPVFSEKRDDHPITLPNLPIGKGVQGG